MKPLLTYHLPSSTVRQAKASSLWLGTYAVRGWKMRSLRSLSVGCALLFFLPNIAQSQSECARYCIAALVDNDVLEVDTVSPIQPQSR